ncbi:hypothetical protein ACOMHN_010584 [Nucella lapillus]
MRGPDDKWAEAVLARIKSVNDLPAADALYHKQCSVNFRTTRGIPQAYQPSSETAKAGKGRPADERRTEAFKNVVEYFKEFDDEQITLTDLCTKMKDYLDSDTQAYTEKHMRQKLESHFGDEIMITCIKGKRKLVTFRKECRAVRRDTSVTPDRISALGRVPGHFYNPSSVDLSLVYEILQDFAVEDRTRKLDLLWKVSWPLRSPRLGWSGMMQNICSGAYPGKSSFTFLPMIDMDPTNMSCIFSTLHFVSSVASRKDVIEKSPGLEPENMGAPLWRLALCLLLSWIVVVLCLIKGIKSSGKVVYFTATFPYVILIILLIRGALFDGAIDGVKYFIIPKWEALTDVMVWVAAAGQMFFSLSVSFGGIIMFGSYNKYTNNVYGDALLISMMDLVTSMIAGFVVFTTFGGMAKSAGTTVDKVAKSGYGLAFVAYPEALSNLVIPQLWSVIFFFMLFTLGLDSEFALMETVLTCIQDEMPKLRRYKSIMCVLFGIGCYFLALPCICNVRGDYVVTLMDHYGADFSVLILSSIEVMSVMWIYGVMRFQSDMEYMLGRRNLGWPYWIFCWSIDPILIACLFLYRMINYVPPKYDNGEPYPQFAQTIGWVIVTVVLSSVPLWFFFHLYRTFSRNSDKPLMEKVALLFRPTEEWRPSDGSQRYRMSNNTLPMQDKQVVNNPAVTADPPLYPAVI